MARIEKESLDAYCHEEPNTTEKVFFGLLSAGILCVMGFIGILIGLAIWFVVKVLF